MGCCLSSTAMDTSKAKAKQKKQNPLKTHHSPLKPPIIPSPFPPPEEEEEETVIKEVLVLSENPILDKKQQEKKTRTPLTSPPETQTEVSSPNKERLQLQQQQEQETSDLSQLSEIYSVAETISTTTATNATTKGSLMDDEAMSKDNSEVKHKPSPAKVIKKRPSNGDPGTAIGRVQARRTDPCPENRARARSQERGSGEMKTFQRNVGSRSRSPATGRGTVGKSPTTVTGKPGNKPVGAGQGEYKREGDKNDVVREQQPETSTTESLENPLVSLECFIFL